MKTRKLVFIALFIAFSFIGANIKIAGTVAFDSMPAFLGGILLGPLAGASIGAIGHYLTALTSGFPLSLPVHLLVMLNMAITVGVFSMTYRKIGKGIAFLIGVILNGPLSIAMVMPLVGKGIMGLLPILSLTAVLNIVIAVAVARVMPKEVKGWK